MKPYDEKICDLDRLAQVAESHRRAGRRVALCHGTFDLLHIGHIRHFEQARRLADVLLVTLTGDAFVNKGPGRPVFGERLRAEHVAALRCVDGVAINPAVTSENVLATIRPDLYVKGGEYRDEARDLTGNIAREREQAEAHGGRLVFTDDITFSSSELLNGWFDVFPAPVRAFLREFKRRHRPDDAIAELSRLESLRVAVIGDAIIDEYHYTEPLGQTGKGSALAVRYVDQEQFAGGAIAVANHVAELAGQVSLITGIGEYESHEAFIRGKLGGNVEPVFFTIPGARTLVKSRFVNTANEKLFEVYYDSGHPLPETVAHPLCRWLDRNLATFDAVIVPDFGNGLISDQVVQRIAANARFLAVNTQVNSGNRGYHVITRYPRADFISLNEPELRMGMRDRHGALEVLAERALERLGASRIAVTRGAEGILFRDRDADRSFGIPALSTTVVDRIGAGDAFLSVAGTALGGGIDSELAAFVGAAAAALDVQIVCNREPVRKAALAKYLTTLLK